MPNQNLLGGTFALFGAKVWTENANEEITVSGLFTVEDMVYSDRTCGQWEAGYWIFRSGQEPDAPMFFIDAHAFCVQTQPYRFCTYFADDGRLIGPVEIWERDQMWAEEKFNKEYADLFNSGDPAEIHPDDRPF